MLISEKGHFGRVTNLVSSSNPVVVQSRVYTFGSVLYTKKYVFG